MFKKDLALLTIAISSPKAQRMVRRRRVTFADLIGNLGKYVALSILPRDLISIHFQGAHSACLVDSVSFRSWNFSTGELSSLEAPSKKSI